MFHTGETAGNTARPQTVCGLEIVGNADEHKVFYNTARPQPKTRTVFAVLALNATAAMGLAFFQPK
jgi:hypothetical protein